MPGITPRRRIQGKNESGLKSAPPGPHHITTVPERLACGLRATNSRRGFRTSLAINPQILVIRVTGHRHAIKSLGLGRRMIYLFFGTLDISRALVGCSVSCVYVYFVQDVGQEMIRQAFLRFRDGSWHEASFLRPRPCSRVFVHLVLLRSVRSGCRLVQFISTGVRAVCGLGDSLDSRSAALFSAYGGH